MATKKRTLPAVEQQKLRNILQISTVRALMDSRRWEPGDIAFQGGTSLHLAYGSARYSEDLDFLVRGGLSLQGLSRAVQKHLSLPTDIAGDLKASVTVGKDEKNPHSFYVSLGGPNVLGSAKVKIELWQAPDAALKSLQVLVSTLVSSAGQAFVPTLSLAEIHADKVYALGARKRIKPRDVFDLWWLAQKRLAALPTRLTVSADALRTRLAIYPVPSGQPHDTAQAWLENAALRMQDLNAPHAAAQVAEDLARWLPSTWPMNAAVVTEMLGVAVTELVAGMRTMGEVMQLMPLIQLIQEEPRE